MARRFARVSLVGILAAAVPSAAIADWYGGDPAAVTTLPLAAFHFATNSPAPGFQAYAFDNFTWTPGAGGGVVDVMGGYYTSFSSTPLAGVTVASWEIRTGLSNGNGGTLIASGTGPATQTSTPYLVNVVGNGPPAYAVERVTIDVPDFTLAPGNYWFAMSIGDAGVGATGFVTNTLGTNGIGGPLGDDLAIYYQGDSSNTSWNWVDLQMAGYNDEDMSYFINEVPAPGAVAVLGLGGFMALRRRRA